MRIQLFLVACLFSLGAATADSPHGISPGDINRKGDACNDFFDYANGAWRKENPIPDYMDRWSRRWQSGELNKEHVRSILDEVSARRDWPAGSAEQLSGDFYGACMAEDQVNLAGIAPVRLLLDEVASIQTRADVQLLVTLLHAVGVDVGFGIASSPDLHDPTQMVADVFASGLGLPDRDYYLKPDDRFVEARAKVPRAHREDVRAGRIGAGRGQCRRRVGLRAGEAICRSDARQRRTPRPAAAGPQDDLRRFARDDARI
jgi:endothelin-converting enzyme/putative endopeptidase